MSLNSTPLTNANIYLFCKAQIAGLTTKKVLIKVSTKYANFTNMFPLNLASKLSKYTSINNHTIKLENSQQLLHGQIYSLRSIELEILKTYIKTNLANGFIRLSKSSTSALIIFDQKLNKSFWLYINYQNPNNFTIKNWYLLSMVGEFLE